MSRKKKEKISGIYRIYNKLTNDEYIGSSCHILNRIRDHFTALSSDRHTNKHLQRIYNKYGENIFGWAILEIVEDEHLIEREQWWIDNIKPKYNLVLIAGDRFMAGRVLSDEHKKKIGAKTAQRMTPEMKKWLSDINLGNTHGKGKILSKEARKIIGEKNRQHLLGHKQSKETVEKRTKILREVLPGIPKSIKGRENIAKAQREKPLSLIHESGRIETFYNLTEFCKNEKISYSYMWKFLSGLVNRTTYKGWKLLEGQYA